MAANRARRAEVELVRVELPTAASTSSSTAFSAGSVITVTANRCSARPAVLDAATTTSVRPSTTGDTTISDSPSSMAASATPASSDRASKRRAVPRNAAAISTRRGLPPATSVIGGSVPTASGATSSTVTTNRWNASPSGLYARTVTVVLPALSGDTASRAPPSADIETAVVATSTSDEEASNASPVPLKAGTRSTSSASPPTCRRASGRLPTAAGGASRTRTSKVCDAEPSLFEAVTVTVTLPAPRGVTTTLSPRRTTASATSGAEDEAPYLSDVPEKASVKSTRRGRSSRRISRSGNCSRTAGAWSRTVARKLAWAEPLAFDAVTVTSVAPTETGTRVSDEPSTSTLTVAASAADAVHVRFVPSNAGAASTSSGSPPKTSETSASGSATAGSTSRTVNWNEVVTAFPLPVAVRVIVVVPGTRGVMTSFEPTTVTEATFGTDDCAV